MANGFFEHTINVIAKGIRALSAQVNNIATEIEQGFDKLPTETELKLGLVRYAVDTGAANAYVVSLPYTPTLTDGLNFLWKATNANTGASTININGLGAKSLILASGQELVDGDILNNQQLWCSYNSVDDKVRILSQSSSAGGGGGNAITITLADESVDTTNYVVFANDATGNEALYTGSNLTFDAATGALTATSFAGALSGNATSATTAGTVTTAAQPNITSVGTLTVLDVDNVNVNGNTITTSTGNLTLDSNGGTIDTDNNLTLSDGELNVSQSDAAQQAGYFYSNTATRTAAVLEAINDNATGSGIALKVQQDQAGNAIDVDLNGDGVGLYILWDGAGKTTPVLEALMSDFTATAPAIETRSTGTAPTLNAEGNSTATVAGRFESNTGNRTVAVVEIVNDQATGSGAALEIQQDQGGPAIDLTSQSTIKFPATSTPSSDANTLDAYEEGTFTPVLWDTSNSDAEGQTYGNQQGTYTRIGDMVFYNIRLTVSSIGTLTGGNQARIGGLPFNAETSNGRWGATAFEGTGLAIGAGDVVTAEVVTDYMQLFKWSATTGTSNLTITEVSGDGEINISGQYRTTDAT